MCVSFTASRLVLEEKKQNTHTQNTEAMSQMLNKSGNINNILIVNIHFQVINPIKDETFSQNLKICCFPVPV